MKVLHLTSSRFFGGPERQMLGLARAGCDLFESSFASFSEQSLCRDFLGRTVLAGCASYELQAPHLPRAVNEVQALIKNQQIDVLFFHSYKACLVGWRAARLGGFGLILVAQGRFVRSRTVRVCQWLNGSGEIHD